MSLPFTCKSIQDVAYTLLHDNFFTVSEYVFDVLNPKILTSKQAIVTSCLSLAAAVDVLIAFAMTFLLLRKQNETGFAR